MANGENVVITGAAGSVGRILRAHWGDRYRLRLADLRPVEGREAHEDFLQTDISDAAQMLQACAGIDVVVHLAADPSPVAEFCDSLLQRNVIGAYNGFEAARQAGCQRVVFASSGQAMLGYAGGPTISWDAPVYPQNVYGATKCWGEALARVYSDQHGLSCICVRLGSPNFDQAGDWDPEAMYANISPRDTAQLFGRCVDVEGVNFAIVPGTSRHRHSWMDVEHTCRVLGYEPQDGTAFPRAR